MSFPLHGYYTRARKFTQVFAPYIPIAKVGGFMALFDKETDNDTVDIYCEFKEPEDPEKIAALEKLFSALYGEEKTLEDICLDCVIMGPDMIELI